jgi:hypothetical protein
MKEVSKIEKNWILEIAGHYYEDRTKQVITERQIAEITNNEKIALSEVSDKNSIKNVVSSRAQEKFGATNLSFSTKRNSNRIYMEVDKNKSDDYYFDDIDNHVIEPNQPKNFKKQSSKVETKEVNENNFEKEDEELDNITLLRRMRNRVNK